MLNSPFPYIYREGNSNDYFEYLISTEIGRNHVNAFFILLNDLQKIHEYIEPNNDNINTYSHRNFELLLCINTEIESNFKAILKSNSYSTSPENMNMNDYKKLEPFMKLSEYKIIYNKCLDIGYFKPYDNFKNVTTLDWWKSYNVVKHNRSEKFKEATLKNVIFSMGGLFILLCAQYGLNNFYPTHLAPQMEDII